MKSLLELLQEESVVVYAMKNHKSCARDFAKMAKENPSQSQEMSKISKDFPALADKKSEELLKIRLEIKKYISMIQNIGEGDSIG